MTRGTRRHTSKTQKNINRTGSADVIYEQLHVQCMIDKTHIPRCHLAFFSGAFLRSINTSGSNVGVVFISMYQSTKSWVTLP